MKLPRPSDLGGFHVSALDKESSLSSGSQSSRLIEWVIEALAYTLEAMLSALQVTQISVCLSKSNESDHVWEQTSSHIRQKREHYQDHDQTCYLRSSVEVPGDSRRRIHKEARRGHVVKNYDRRDQSPMSSSSSSSFARHPFA